MARDVVRSQDLIGGLDVKVDRNHFGRQNESFEADLELDFLRKPGGQTEPFRAVFGCVFDQTGR